jgi:hypothetical protein
VSAWFAEINSKLWSSAQSMMSCRRLIKELGRRLTPPAQLSNHTSRTQRETKHDRSVSCRQAPPERAIRI